MSLLVKILLSSYGVKLNVGQHSVPLGSLYESVIIDTNYLPAVSSDSGAPPPRTLAAQFEMHLKICAQKSAQF